ncbi:helix-turn-helix domain-containing protein [Sulfitobacter sp.]|uniref:helix-turn-helix domain-containing protein n=1 Tax=Sulfitobacter sp. TaxID=1903071 RepID=UPI003564B7B4
MSAALRKEMGIDEILARLESLTQLVEQMTQQKGPELLTTDQVAEMLDVTPRTVSRWRAQGKFTPHNRGKTPLYALEEVTEMMPASNVTPIVQQSRQR